MSDDDFLTEMAKDSKQSINSQRGKEKGNTGKQPGKPPGQKSPHDPKDKGGKGK
jgi:hypothetical protein